MTNQWHTTAITCTPSTTSNDDASRTATHPHSCRNLQMDKFKDVDGRIDGYAGGQFDGMCPTSCMEHIPRPPRPSLDRRPLTSCKTRDRREKPHRMSRPGSSPPHGDNLTRTRYVCATGPGKMMDQSLLSCVSALVVGLHNDDMSSPRL